MTKRRTLRQILLGLHLAIGLIGAVGCQELGYAQGWAGHTLLSMEELEDHEFTRIERVRITRDPGGPYRLAIEVLDVGGQRHAFTVNEQGPLGSVDHGDWTSAVVHLGFTHFLIGTEVYGIDADGIVADAAHPLTAEERARALLVLLSPGASNDWYVSAYPPPPGGRDIEKALASAPLVRFALPIAVTESSRRKRDIAGVFLIPLAFVVDVITWPVQLIAHLVAMSSVAAH